MAMWGGGSGQRAGRNRIAPLNRKPEAHYETGYSRRVVCVIDDDPSIRGALAGLFRSVGHEVALFDAAAPFLRDGSHESVGCLVVDIRLPGIGGLQFQNLMARVGSTIPIVFMTGYGDVEMSVKAMKAGAVDFLEKPFRDQDILDAVAAALERDRRWRDSKRATSDLRAAFASLTPREKEVMAFVAAGLMNKQIASAMGLSEVTVKIHRGHLMRKIGARSLPDLVRMADTLAVQPPHVPGNTGRSGVAPLETSVW
jgi:FixJ family two-component response regulator